MTQAANLAALGTNASTTGILPAAGGGTAGFADGAGTSASFSAPSYLALNPFLPSQMLISDAGNHRLRTLRVQSVSRSMGK